MPADDPLALGHAALEAGKLADARALFTRAYKWRPDVESAAGLAEAEDRLGLHPEAATHFSLALSLLPSGADPSRRRELQARLLEQKKFVATVVVRLPGAAGVKLLVDGIAAGDSPLPLPIYLSPGTHALTATAEGRAFVGAEIVVQAAQVVSVALREVEARGAEPPAKPLWPTFVLGSVSAAGIALGIGTLVVSLQRETQIEERAASIQACDPAALDPSCSDLATLVSERNGLRNASTVGFVAGGVAAAAMLGYLFIPWPSETPESAARASSVRSLWAAPILGPGHWGLVFGGELF